MSLLHAGVVELVDTPDLGSGGESRGGSSPFARTKSTVQRGKGSLWFLESFIRKASEA